MYGLRAAASRSVTATRQDRAQLVYLTHVMILVRGIDTLYGGGLYDPSWLGAEKLLMNLYLYCCFWATLEPGLLAMCRILECIQS